MRVKKINRLVAGLALLCCLGLIGCMRSPNEGASTPSPTQAELPKIPSSLEKNEEGIPMLKVYDLSKDTQTEMDIETYVCGVLAGEMRNDWPEEALKAQAILARTFVLKFIETKDSKYKGADISTDVSEAQAYSADLVNERVRDAVAATRGQVVSYKGELANTWFHAHSGGVTELPTVGLEYESDPPYTKSVSSKESERAPENVKQWTAEFSLEQIKSACAGAGVQVDDVDTVQMGRKGKSGRAETLIIDDKSVSAPKLRLQLGANQLKSTLITDMSVEDGTVTFTGKGFGHGVGMSQWGAYAMAEDGKSAADIVQYYFKNVDIVPLWQ